MESGEEVYIQTIGDLKKLLETLPDNTWIDYIDFTGGDTVLVSIRDAVFPQGHATVILDNT